MSSATGLRPTEPTTETDGLPRQSRVGSILRGRAANLQDLLLGLAATIALVVIWQLALQAGLLDSKVIPPPHAVLNAWASGLGLTADDNPITHDLVVTVARLVIGFGSGVAIGALLGLTAGMYRPVRDFLEPLVAIVNVIPAVVTLPVIALWSGVGNETIVLVTMYSTVIPVYRGSLDEIRLLNRRLVWATRSLGATGVKYTTSLIVPVAAIGALKNIRVALGYAWRASIAAEILVVAQTGLGSLTFNAHQFGNISTMIAAILTILVVGLVLDLLAMLVQSRLLAHRGLIIK